MKATDSSEQRVELSSEWVAEVDRLISEVPRYWPDDPLGVSAIAVRLGILPLSLDSGGVVGLKRDGSIVGVDWDDPSRERPIIRIRDRDVALILGSERYEFLKSVLPARSSDARVCPQCSGTGVDPLAADANVNNVVCQCAGLGWIPDDWEKK